MKQGKFLGMVVLCLLVVRAVAADAGQLPAKWDILFKSKSGVVTEYSSEHDIRLSGVLLENINLSGETLSDAVFTDTHWKKLTALNTSFVNTRFFGGRISDTTFAMGSFRDVTFENVTFDKVDFTFSSFTRVKFVNCVINEGKFRKLSGDAVVFEDSSLRGPDFDSSELHLLLKNTSVRGDYGGFQALGKNVVVVLYKSSLKKNNVFSFRGRHGRLFIISSEIDGIAIDDYVDSVIISDSKLENARLSSFDAGSVIVERSLSDDIGIFSHVTAEQLVIKDCQVPNRIISIRTGVAKQIIIDKCRVGLLDMESVRFDEMQLKDLIIDERLRFTAVNGRELRLRDIELNGKIEVKYGEAENVHAENLNFGPDAELKIDKTDSILTPLWLKRLKSNSVSPSPNNQK